jgi:pyrimidine operon attenuation protein/uracil phosphoribosyltransferase
MDSKNYILNKDVAARKMLRMAYEILENNMDEKEIILAGIRESGSVVARCIQRCLQEISGLKISMLTITLDKKQPREVSVLPAMDFNNKVIVIVDDVANSGRTMLYAIKPFLDFFPKKIQTLVLVERSHNHFPVRPDYVGLSISTTLQEHIYVEVEGEEVIGAFLQ